MADPRGGNGGWQGRTGDRGGTVSNRSGCRLAILDYLDRATMINFPSRGGHPLVGWLSAPVLLIALMSTLPITGATRAQSLAAVPVRYDVASQTIYIGENYSDPALSAYPSAPGAPKSPITIPQIAAALNNPALLQDQGNGAWLLKANLVILAT